MTQIVEIRLVAASKQALIAAIEKLQTTNGNNLQNIRLPNRPGRRGDWVCYALLVIEIN